ncbi:MAG: thioredoxin family protein [Planctomycetes bacterium]|nr:thioredoxin family protein [Planctomycetota bacterium]
MPRTPLSASAVVLVVFVASESQATAQEVQWRQDYAAARREATETGKPLMFDFGTENCSWCRKLDATTFRDPRVVKLLNERFIPVKIDADKHAKLTSALGIESYPTLVLATPEGKVAGRHPGYADAAEFTTFLNKAPASAPVAAASPPAPPAPTAPAVVRPVASVIESDADKWRRVKEQIDADLAALHPKIAVALER